MPARLDAPTVETVRSDASWARAISAVLTGREPLTMLAQPIIDLTGGEVVGFEMLSRFPQGRPTAPQEWFLAAARVGLDVELNALAVRIALSRRADLPLNTFLALNVDPDALVDPRVREAFEEPHDLARVVVELTEHVPVRRSSGVVEAVDQLRERGALLAIDDAGAGYANMRSLMIFRPELVKIDRELVTGLGADPVRRTVVQSLAELASRLDAWVIAEGVESTTDLRELAEMGIALGQGWLLGRPAPAMTRLPRPVPRAGQSAYGTPSVLASTGLRGVMEPAVQVEAADPISPGVVCDSHGRPQSVVVCAPDGNLVSVPAMTANLDAEQLDVLPRAMARPESYRFAPVVCTDMTGRAVGTVTLDKLVNHLQRRVRALQGLVPPRVVGPAEPARTAATVPAQQQPDLG